MFAKGYGPVGRSELAATTACTCADTGRRRGFGRFLTCCLHVQDPLIRFVVLILSS